LKICQVAVLTLHKPFRGDQARTGPKGKPEGRRVCRGRWVSGRRPAPRSIRRTTKDGSEKRPRAGQSPGPRAPLGRRDLCSGTARPDTPLATGRLSQIKEKGN
jgi:hypothetical protein